MNIRPCCGVCCQWNWTAVALRVVAHDLPGGNDRTVLCPQPLGGAPRWVALRGCLGRGDDQALRHLQAVDGVALKQAVDAWATPHQQGDTLCQCGSHPKFMAGVGPTKLQEPRVRSRPVLSAVTIVHGRQDDRLPDGAVGAGLAGGGLVVGVEGFSPAGALPSIAGQVLLFIWTIWLAIAAWPLRKPPRLVPGLGWAPPCEMYHSGMVYATATGAIEARSPSAKTVTMANMSYQLRKLGKAILQPAAHPPQSPAVADSLVENNLMGHNSHGVIQNSGLRTPGEKHRRQARCQTASGDEPYPPR